MKKVVYVFGGKAFHMFQKPGESKIQAVTRALGRKTGPVTVWWSGRAGDLLDVYTAKWFDEKTETFREVEVFL